MMFPSWNEYYVPLDCASKQWRLIVVRFKRFDGRKLFIKLRKGISLHRDQHWRDDPSVHEVLGTLIVSGGCCGVTWHWSMEANGVLCLVAYCLASTVAVGVAFLLAKANADPV
jgi:hypothetical protein